MFLSSLILKPGARWSHQAMDHSGREKKKPTRDWRPSANQRGQRRFLLTAIIPKLNFLGYLFIDLLNKFN
jgi:hypothetical protein